MHVFMYQPSESILEAQSRRLDSLNVKCSPIDESFFHPETVKAVSSSITTASILIADDGGADGYVKSLRRNGCLSPIICILPHRDSRRATELIDAGADDVLIVPITALEVIARCKAIIRRSYGHVAPSVMIGDVEAYFDGRDPEVNG